MSLDKALLEARRMMTMPTKNSTAEMGNRGKYRYADLAGVLDTVTGPLLDNGILLRQFPSTQESQWVLTTELTHAESGETKSFTFPLLVAKQDAQGFGSSVTYARRYAILGLLGLSPEDDDGKKACEPVTVSPAALPDPKVVSSALVDARKKVMDMASMMTKSEAEIMGFIAHLAKSDNSLTRWEARSKDMDGLREAFKRWSSENGIKNES